MPITMMSKYVKNTHTYIKYACDVCGYRGEMRASHYKNGIGCPVCNGKRVLKGFNDVATKKPELIKYFVDRDDAFNITPYSHKRVKMRCPTCGCIVTKRMSDVSNRGFKCNICYGGFSYPSRFITALLHVSSIEFKTEMMFKWSGNRRYDFYIPKYKLLLEVNGIQHYRQTNYSKDIDKTIRNDDTKLSLAIINGYNFECIDARVSSFQWMKLSTELSGLSKYIDMNTVDWDEVKRISEVEIGSSILNLWNSGMKKTIDIALALNISTTTVRKYLKLYNNIDECDYDASEAILENQHIAAQSRKRCVICLNTGEVFPSIRDASDKTGICYNSIQNCLAGRSESAGKDNFGNKLKWKYIQ